MLRLLYSEQIKLKRSGILLMSFLIPIVVNALLTVDLHFRYPGYLLIHQAELGLTGWQLILMEQRIFYFPALLPFFAALILAQVFYSEKKNNTWQLLITQPIQKYRIVLSKFLLSCKYILILILCDVITLILSGAITGVADPFPAGFFIRYTIILIVSVIAADAVLLVLFVGFRTIWPGLLCALILGIMSQGKYDDNMFGKINIYSYVDYAYKSSWNDVTLIIAVSVIGMLAGLMIAVITFEKIRIEKK